MSDSLHWQNEQIDIKEKRIWQRDIAPDADCPEAEILPRHQDTPCHYGNQLGADRRIQRYGGGGYYKRKGVVLRVEIGKDSRENA